MKAPHRAIKGAKQVLRKSAFFIVCLPPAVVLATFVWLVFGSLDLED